mgnify:CR=1 FL=1
MGTVISDEQGLHVITKIVNGQIANMERLEDFIARNVVLEYEGELRTLKEIIQDHCDEYLLKHEIIEI